MSLRDTRKKVFKIIVLGDGYVGKTAITVRYCEGEFRAEYKMTIGVSFGVKDFGHYSLQIWDIAGQERFGAFRTNYYSGAFGAILVYDVTNRLTFLDLPNWIAEMQNIIGYIPCLVVGNKVDLPGSAQLDKQVPFQEGKNFADAINAGFFETSAKEDYNIDNMFKGLIALIRDKVLMKEFKIDTFESIELGFRILEQTIKQQYSPSNIYDSLLRLKQAIFQNNPYSIVLGNMSNWIQALTKWQWDEQIQRRLLKSLDAWRYHYTKSLPDGQAVTSKI